MIKPPPVILLHEELNSRALERAKGELEAISKQVPQEVLLIINSNGGSVRGSIEFVEAMKRMDATFIAKIYRADSSAAFIALSCDERFIVEWGSIGIHLGAMLIEAAHIENEQHFARVQDELVSFRNDMLNIVNKKMQLPRGHFGTLLNTGAIILTAEEAVRFKAAQPAQ